MLWSERVENWALLLLALSPFMMLVVYCFL